MKDLIKDLIVATDTYLKACTDESINDLCYPIDYANAPFYVLEKMGVDVENMSEFYTLNHFADIDIANHLKDNVIPILINELNQ